MFRNRMPRFALLLLSAAIFLGASKCEEKEAPKVVDEMIEGFASGCNLGAWTRAALDRANTITGIYQTLQSKASCKDNANLQRALGAATSLQSELRAIQADEARQRERKMEEASTDLMIALSAPGLNATIKDSLMAYYATTRYELSLARADVNYVNNPGYKARMTLGLERVNTHMRDLLGASQGLAECYKDNPSVAIQLGASLAELGGAFAPPMIGLGISAVSNLIKVAVEAARLAPSAEAIYEVRKQRMPIAMACGMEAIARDYCKARDARVLLTAANRDSKRELLPFFFGVDLADRHLPTLYAWLDRVVNGTDSIRDPEQAGKLNQQFSRILMAQNAKRSAQGYFAETKQKIDRSTDIAIKVSYIRNQIRTLVSIFYCNQPFEDPNSCVFSGGETAREFVTIIAPNGIPSDFDPSAGYAALIGRLQINPGDLELLEKKFNAMFASRYTEVVRDFNEKVNVDLSSLVRDASRVDMEELSPLSALERLFQFLDKYSFEDGASGQRDRIIIRQLRGKLDNAYTQLIDPNSVSDENIEVSCPEDPLREERNRGGDRCFEPSPAAKVIAVTFDTFKLDKNNVYLPGIMRGLIKTDLTTRYLKGEGPKEVRDLFRLAGQDLSLLLSRANLTPAQVMADISAAQSLSSRNVEQFRSFFAPALGKAMLDLWQAAEEFKEPPAGDPAAPNRNLLSQLCVLTYISGMQWPSQVNYELCRDAKLVSREAGLTLTMDGIVNKLHDKSFDDRICAYEEFLRTDRLANLGLKKPGEKRGSNPRGFINAVFSSEEGHLTEEDREFWQSVITR
jgi:hypothetical protein